MRIDLLVTTYKRLDDLNKLINNLEEQTYKNFRLQIFDGTPDDSIKNAINKYLSSKEIKLQFKILFYRLWNDKAKKYCSRQNRRRYLNTP